MWRPRIRAVAIGLSPIYHPHPPPVLCTRYPEIVCAYGLIELHGTATTLLRFKSLLSEPATPYIGLWFNTQNPNLNCDRRIGWRHHTRVLSTSRIGCLLISFFQNPEQKPGP
jgi:hypothetical protein